MITNERQYRITKAAAERFRKAIAESETAETNLSPRMKQAMLDGLRSQLDDLCNEMAKYDALKQGQVRELKYDSLADLPKALIAARIAANLTQKQLAERLGLKEQQIQRYEANEYSGASMERIMEVAEALRLSIRGTAHLSKPEALSRA